MSEHRDRLHVLRYPEPAREWVEALPLGDGSLGAMCFGGLLSERIALNDDTAWSGSPASERMPPLVAGADAIEAARAAIAEGRHADADRALRGIQHRHSQAYLPLADLRVDISGVAGEVTEYERMLDLRTATHETRGAVGGVGITRRTWVSATDGVLVHEISAAEPVAVRIGLETPLRLLGAVRTGPLRSITIRLPADVSPPHDDVADPVSYAGESLRAAVACRVEHDGVERDGVLEGVRVLRLVLAARTTYAGPRRPPEGDEATALAAASARIAAAAARPAAALHRDHVAAHAALYDRAELELEGLDADTPSRLAAVQRGDSEDPALTALLFHYGRYLLICSSRPASLPATLQGIWNEDLPPVWSSNYTVNINLQMNYWGADVTGLSCLLEPVMDLLEHIAAGGAETAARLYGAPGWVLHHNTDAWAYTQQIGHGRHDPAHVFWPFGGVWLLVQLCDSLRFGASAGLRDRLVPLMRGAVEFTLHWLRADGDGMLGTSPSTSPENVFTVPGGTSGLSADSAMDLTLAAQLLDRFAALAAETGDSSALVARAARARSRLKPLRLDAQGAVAEWGGEEAAADPHHRHVSPLVFLYPGADEPSAALAAAAARLLDLRGDESTGWSLVWKAALRARLRDAGAVERLLALLLRDMSEDRGGFSGGLYPNLFAAHPPFQIDANLGLVGAIAETLVQSHRGEIELLPAWPASLGAGRARGIVARPGVTVDLSWGPDGVSARLEDAHPGAAGRHRVRWRDQVLEVDVPGSVRFPSR
ncbi:glycoside hydrolase family 95 protein [Microbacterium hydrocarbonoxydans]|uniref:glycoside hydrolase family 95 protein n=1 Tax=Microbacterium hydrocarbonoxydans TaxID=273678 RepID=UPI0013DBB63D|nr:glycoside hydrolase family 95 protein [Microbacterium hydrocarbonoxydans]